MRFIQLIFCFLLLFSPGFGHAIIYESEQNGTLTFSDVQTPGSQAYSLNASSISSFDTANAGKTLPANGADSISESSAIATSGSVITNTEEYSSIEITSPQDQSTFQNSLPVNISVSTIPKLKNGDRIQLMVDGAPYGDPQTNTNFTIDNLTRGTHQIQARIVTVDGKTPKTSLAITVFKHQASQLLNT